jgi:hypothetical protein
MRGYEGVLCLDKDIGRRLNALVDGCRLSIDAGRSQSLEVMKERILTEDTRVLYFDDLAVLGMDFQIVAGYPAERAGNILHHR